MLFQHFSSKKQENQCFFNISIQKSKKTNAFSTFQFKKARKPMLFQHFSSKKQENQCFFNNSAQKSKTTNVFSLTSDPFRVTKGFSLSIFKARYRSNAEPDSPGAGSLIPPAQKSKKTNAFSTFQLKKARKPMLFQHFSSKKQENQWFFNISAQKSQKTHAFSTFHFKKARKLMLFQHFSSKD